MENVISPLSNHVPWEDDFMVTWWENMWKTLELSGQLWRYMEMYPTIFRGNMILWGFCWKTYFVGKSMKNVRFDGSYV